MASRRGGATVIRIGQLRNCSKTLLSQAVSLDRACSEPADVLSGVPQGSLLGPLLFLIFFNDVESFGGGDIRFYADDCILFYKVKTVNDQRLLNRSLERLSE